MRIIPAIDIIDGKCVRLTQGDYAQKKVYNENPLDVARSFEASGLKYLHLVDLDGARAGKVINWQVIDSITAGTNLEVDFGGGIKTEAEIEKLFRAGVKQINLGSISVKNPEQVARWINSYGSDKIILSADVKNDKIAIGGWLEDSTISIIDFIRDYLKKGIIYITCTDISTDGMLTGPNIDLYTKLLNTFPAIKLIASGGVSSMNDLMNLKDTKVEGVIVGKAIYEGRVDIHTLATLTH
jgi:phosphoribosylformimino-5-aminoimidazole carboxamide ribotide isomerase